MTNLFEKRKKQPKIWRVIYEIVDEASGRAVGLGATVEPTAIDMFERDQNGYIALGHNRTFGGNVIAVDYAEGENVWVAEMLNEADKILRDIPADHPLKKKARIWCKAFAYLVGDVK